MLLTDPRYGLPVILGALFLSGCNNYIDGSKVETSILEGLQEKTGLSIKTVSCPEKEPIQVDDTFQCTVTLEDDQSFRTDVTQEDNEGNIIWNAQEGLNNLKGVIDNELLAKQITDGILEQTEIEVETDCGKLFRIARKGQTFTCTTTDVQDNIRDVKVEAQDDDGNVAWEL